MIVNPLMYLKIGLFIALMSTCSACYVLYNQNVKLKVDIVSKDKQIDEINKYISSLTMARVDDQLQVLDYSNKLSKIERDYRDAVKKLEKQKQKKEAILRHPGLVTNSVNTASERMFNSISCLTGDLQKCSTDTSTTTPTSVTD